MIRNLLIITSCLFGAVYSYGLEEVTSVNGGDRLKSFHERFPKSDSNSDGILTVDEMHNFFDSKIKDGSKSEKTEKKVSLKNLKGLKGRVYLSIFLQESPNSDLDKDGVLTKAELLKYILSQRKVINENGEKIPAPQVIAAAQ